ncbi:MAG: family hydrolase [Spartobacteria bacterium]|nr:family hydrolase [Spartobacteria bacterium]
MPLAVRKISYSSKFMKTLFVEFKTDSALQKLVNRLSPGAKAPHDPHLSLLYQNLGIGAKKELAATIKLPFEDVIFDAIKAVRCVSPTTTAGEVGRWQVVATKILRR